MNKYALAEENLKQYQKMGIIGKVWSRDEQQNDTSVRVYYIEIVADTSSYGNDAFYEGDGAGCLETVIAMSTLLVTNNQYNVDVRDVNGLVDRTGLKEVM